MYEVYVDGECVSASYIPGSLFREPVIEKELNRAGSFTFTIPVGHPAFNSFKVRKSSVIVQINRRQRAEFSGFVTRISRNITGEKKVTCTGDLALLSNAGFYVAVKTLKASGYVRQIFTLYNNVCTDRPFDSSGMVGDDFDLDPGSVSYGSCLDLCQKFVEEYGGAFEAEMNWVNGRWFRKLKYTAEGAETESKQVIHLNRNIIDLALEQSGEEICTGVFPLGAKKTDEEKDQYELGRTSDSYWTIQDILYTEADENYIWADNSVINEFGRILKVIQWDGVKKANTLTKNAKAYLKDYQFASIAFDLKAIDLSDTNEDEERIEVGYKVQCVSQIHGMDRVFVVSKKTIPLNHLSETRLTLGITSADTLTRYVVSGGKKKKRVYTFDSINPDDTGGGTGGGGTTVGENVLTYDPNEKTLTITKLKNTPTYDASTKTLTIT